MDNTLKKNTPTNNTMVDNKLAVKKSGKSPVAQIVRDPSATNIRRNFSFASLATVTTAAVTSAKLVVVVAIPSIGLGVSSPAFAETCYLDNRGRIVTRRRVGYQEVECPETADAPTLQPGDEAATSTEQGATQDPPGSVAQPVVQPTRTNAPSRRVNPVSTIPGRSQRGAAPVARKKNAPSPIPQPKLEDYREFELAKDRWRIVDSALGYKDNLLDPYNRNPLKADRPLHDDWFFNTLVIADTIYETRDIPTPVGASSTLNPSGLDVFGDDYQTLAAQIVAAEFVYYKGNTVFKPPDHEFRLTLAFNYNRTVLEEIQGVNASPRDGVDRNDRHLGVQAAFYDKHLRNVSDRYDFDSFRIGVQPFSSDFRGFLFQDNQFGARLFGIRDNNKWQYNLAWFRRIEKDTNSGLNDVSKGLREDDVFVANLTRQDWPVIGFFSQGTILYNRNREDEEFYFNNNEFIERPASLGRETPRGYDVVYLGYNADGHIDRLNLTTSAYYAFGSVSPGVFVDEDVDVSAGFLAAELSADFDWIRPRISFMYASGDDNAFDDTATGFDAVFENPQFAGGETSYWNRQAVPLIGGGRVALSSRNSFLNALRSSKEEGQSNFTNPGLLLFGVGVDLDILPELRLSANLNSLFFDNTAVLEAARNQTDIDKAIGTDFSLSVIYRPWMSQNIVLRASFATLLPGDGFDALFPNEDAGYFLFNATFNY